MIGTTLSHFKITAKLGEGGMGEVYLAQDTKLERQVAIKVLPEAVATDRERLARFEREAKVLASLNHPNIAAIYQVEQDNDTHFLVMELVEGEDLKQRLERGAIELEEALPLALQIAEALEFAHENGIVHRDLKPANVKVTPNGQVKVLDFGLAKALDSTTDSESGGVGSNRIQLSMSPTLTAEMTGAGVILGTAAYMSPEQARGKVVDKRTDVWAFGVLLWEMLTSHSIFSGETVTDVIAAVVTREPDIDELPESTPREVKRLLMRCLRKDHRSRLPDIGAARLELQDVLAGTTPEVEAPGADLPPTEDATTRRRSGGRWAWVVAALIGAGLAVLLLSILQMEEPDPPQTVRFAMEAPEGWELAANGFEWPVPSPDGQRVVFRAWPEDSRGDIAAPMLWIRSLDSLAAHPLVGTEGALAGLPTWSPDGESILYQGPGAVRKLRLTDGTVQTLMATPATGGFLASWNNSGTIIFSKFEPNATIYSLSDAGGESTQVTTLDTTLGETSHTFPQFFPDGNRFLFLVGSSQVDAQGLYVSSLEEPDRRKKIADDWVRRIYTSDHLLFVGDGNLYAQPFETKDAALTSNPVAIASSVQAWPVFPGIGWFGSSSTGTVAYFTGASQLDQVQLTWFDRTGLNSQSFGAPGLYGQIALSPDGRNVALEIRDALGQYDLWVMDVARGVTSRVTATPEDERDPVWSPDSHSLAYIRRGDDGASLRRKGLRASDSDTLLMDSADEDVPESWSSDGKTIMVVRRTAEDEQSVWALSLAEDGEAQPILDTTFRVDEPQISPDGLWLAYVSPESDQDEVYLEPFRREGDRVRVSLDGGGQPKWRGDSQELFFTTLDGFLMAVEVRSEGGRLEVSLPKELFRIGQIEGTGYDDYSVSADGSRFLVKVPIGAGVEPQLQIISNWTGLLD